MKSLEQLIELAEPAFPMIEEWVASAANDCVLLPPSTNRAEILLAAQVSTRSTMGAIAYETGGVMIDNGWLRVLGSGHPRLARTLSGWNENKADRGYLIADDAAGGFFAINGGAFGDDLGNVYYWPPDSLELEPMGRGYSDFLDWALTGDLAEFYASVRWSMWKEEVASLTGDRCIAFYPYLWTEEGSLETSHRHAVLVEEAFMLKQDLLRQIQGRKR
jgi:Protein of unknown function DUF2625